MRLTLSVSSTRLGSFAIKCSPALGTPACREEKDHESPVSGGERGRKVRVHQRSCFLLTLLTRTVTLPRSLLICSLALRMSSWLVRSVL